MNSNKILVLASTSNTNNIVGGVVTKSRILWDYVDKVFPGQACLIDTDSWRDHPVSLIGKIVWGILQSKVIILCSFDIGAAKVLNLLSRIGKRKVIYYFVGGGELHKSIRTGKYPLAWYKDLRKIFVESQVMVDDLNQMGLSNTYLMRNFRNAHHELTCQLAGQTLKFVFFARVIEEKGIRLALQAVTSLLTHGYDIRFDFYGPVDSEYFKTLEMFLNEKVQYKGCINPDGKSEYKILSQYDVLLLPTFYPQEGFPGTIIDAYISGLAVISSDFEYAKEFVDNSTGRICSMNNVDSLYECMEELILNPTLVNQLKQAAKARSFEYDVDQVLNSFRQDLVQCLKLQ